MSLVKTIKFRHRGCDYFQSVFVINGCNYLNNTSEVALIGANIKEVAKSVDDDADLD
jgi:hypothetical protein